MLELPKLKKRETYERVAFFGPMCSGKSFLAKVLLDHKNYVKVSFADKLKALTYDLYGIQGKDGMARKLLQEFADDIKKWDEDIFIKHMLLRVKRLEEDKYPPRIVCDDLRFEAEGRALKKAGFTLIQVTCDEEVRAKRIATLYPNTLEGAQNHRSEQQWKLIPHDYSVDSSNINAILGVLGIINGLEDSTSRKA